MKTNFPGADYWVRRISEQEMPALGSMIRTLEQLAKDEVSSMAVLGRSIMHDNALTSRVLRVANSAIYNKGISQVTTLSRAAVVLGFDVIRNICITAKLLTSLLENKNMSPAVYQRLLKLMAHSFQSAMLTKMMLADYGEELQEEAFIASLLYHLGESAFWSVAGQPAEELDGLLTNCDNNISRLQVSRDYLGLSFNQLTQGLARSWGLGELLMKSLLNPDERTPEVRTIFLANKLSDVMSDSDVSPEELQRRLRQCAELMALPITEFQQRLQLCLEATRRLSIDYGAKVLLQHLPKRETLAQLAPSPQLVPRVADVSILLEKLRQLTLLAQDKPDFNQVILTALQGLLDGLGLDRCAVLLLSPNRKRLQPRITLGDNAEQMKQSFVLELNEDAIMLKSCLEKQQACWQGKDSETLPVGDILQQQLPVNGYLVAPLRVENKTIGIFYADRQTTGREISQQDFDSFTHVAQLANLCLSLAFRGS
ncbi:HDOD domain-containing protein [Shewanella fodinae]|uniref:HDOD domain-containing protein n=1 Tax=Shewanella fodinae TaxID=552357 RepID=UPI0027E4D922|nr:HDOD domain-containing protein [Shewanella fodinae]